MQNRFRPRLANLPVETQGATVQEMTASNSHLMSSSSTAIAEVTPADEVFWRLLGNCPDLLAALGDTLPEMICVKDGEGKWLAANSGYLEILGLKNIDYRGKTDAHLAELSISMKPILSILEETDRETWISTTCQRYETNLTGSGQFEGVVKWIKMPLFTAEGAPEALLVVATPIDMASHGQHILADLFEGSSQGLVVTDDEFCIQQVNPALLEISGYSVSELIGKTPAIFKSSRQEARNYRSMWASLRENGQWQGEIHSRRKSGDVCLQWLSIHALTSQKAEITRYIGIYSDISDRKSSEQQIYRLAYYDALTELPNRVLFMDRLKHSLPRGKRNRHLSAVLFMDLDRFKSVNDSLGHDHGDLLLKQTAIRLQGILRKEDTIARMGGDEFTVLLEGFEDRDAAESTVAAIANKIIAELGKPFMLRGHEVYIGVSIGITLYPDDGIGADELLKNADMSMYYAKQNGRNNFKFYTQEMGINSIEELQLESYLRRALENNEFDLHFQPQVVGNGDQIVGTEALLRWRHPKLGMVPPVKFIPIAEQNGLIGSIGAWVLREACRVQKKWMDAGFATYRMAVNLSAGQFRQPNLAEFVESVLDEIGLAPQFLELEITESILMEDTESTRETLHQLSQLGVGLAVDDFGTGYSSLAYLKRFPISALKIDRSFVSDITNDTNDAAISSAIIAMANSLGLKVIAEGVETKAQMNFLRRQGCHEMQGFYFSEPLPRSKIEVLFANPGTLRAGDQQYLVNAK